METSRPKLFLYLKGMQSPISYSNKDYEDYESETIETGPTLKCGQTFVYGLT